MEPTTRVRRPGEGRISSARSVLWIMFAINLLNYLDRWILPAVGPKIQAQWGISDAALGALGTAFTLVYGIAALPFGIWADRSIRKNVVALGVGIWSLATLLSGAVGSATQLFFARAAVGIGEAGYYPAGTSLLIDYFPRERRASVLSVWNVGASMGAALGFALGGLVADHLGWRWAFYLTVVPGLICTALAYGMREPQRGASDDLAHGVGSAPSIRRAVGAILQVRTMRIVMVAQTLNVFVLGGAAFWFPTLLTRRFHISLTEAGLISGLVLVGAGITGALGGGWIADRLMPRLSSARLLVSGIGFLASVPLLILALVVPTLSACIPIFFLGALFLSVYNGPLTALTQEVVRPELRAATVALTLIAAHVLGDAFAPALLGGLSDALGHDLLTAMRLTLAPIMLAAGLVSLAGLRFVAADMQAARRPAPDQAISAQPA